MNKIRENEVAIVLLLVCIALVGVIALYGCASSRCSSDSDCSGMCQYCNTTTHKCASCWGLGGVLHCDETGNCVGSAKR